MAKKRRKPKRLAKGALWGAEVTKAEQAKRRKLTSLKHERERELARDKRKDAKLAELQAMVRQAARSGAAEAIEHCANFWSVSDGYKKYIDHQIALQSDTLLAAVRVAVRAELGLREIAPRPRKR